MATSVTSSFSSGIRGLSWLEAAWVGVLVLITLTIPLGTPWPLRLAAVGFLLSVLFKRQRELVAPALLVFFLFLGPVIYPRFFWQVPTLPFVSAIFLTGLLCLPGSRAVRAFSWLKRGELDSISQLLVVVTSLVAAAALMLWALWTDNLGAGASMVKELEGIPPWFLFLVGVPAFALLNAAAEEAVYRGFLQESLERIFPGKILLVLGLQASAFAAAHFGAGFPNGKMGYAMAFVYALMLGYLRIRTGGMLAPFLAHVAADLVIGFTLILLAL